MQWASLSDVPQMDTSPNLAQSNVLTYLIQFWSQAQKFQTETSSVEQIRNGRQNGSYREMRISQFCELRHKLSFNTPFFHESVGGEYFTIQGQGHSKKSFLI